MTSFRRIYAEQDQYVEERLSHPLPCPVCREGVKPIDGNEQTCPTCATQLELVVPFDGRLAPDYWKIKAGTAVHYDPSKHSREGDLK